MTDNVTRRIDNGVMELRLDRPDKKNALTAAMYRALSAGLAEAAADPAITAVLITAEGGAFSAGNDIKDFLAPGGAAAALDFIRALAGFGKPIVAAVQGVAVGVGTTMLLHCDLVYAAPDARFLVPFVGLGLVPEAASSLLLPARIGQAKASAMLLLGEPLEAEAAERAGLVTAIVPAEALRDHARARAAALTRVPPSALAATRALIRGDRAAIKARIDAEAALFETLIQSAEAREAFTAFLEKRPPDFRKAGAL
ncbi:MAG TPA: enoyl-CoA hydratase-related protein [Sphingomonas sp.]